MHTGKAQPTAAYAIHKCASLTAAHALQGAENFPGAQMAGAPSLPQRLGGMGLVLHHTGHSTTRKAFGRAYRIIRRIYIYISIYICISISIYIYRCVAHSSKRTASSTRISLGQPPTVRCSLSATFRHSFDKLAWSYSTVKPTANFDHIQVLNTK